MRITLREKAAMWFLPGKVHLTFADPIFEIDVQTLSDDEIRTVCLAVKSGHIHIDDIEAINSRLVIPVKKEIPPPEDKSKKLQELVEATLKQDLPAIKRVIETSPNPTFLRLLEAQERAGKARKTVLSAIQGRKDKLVDEVKLVVGNDSADFINPDNDGLIVSEESVGDVQIEVPGQGR